MYFPDDHSDIMSERFYVERLRKQRLKIEEMKENYE
jgi:hypothetical protein